MLSHRFSFPKSRDTISRNRSTINRSINAPRISKRKVVEGAANSVRLREGSLGQMKAGVTGEGGHFVAHHPRPNSFKYEVMHNFHYAAIYTAILFSHSSRPDNGSDYEENIIPDVFRSEKFDRFDDCISRYLLVAGFIPSSFLLYPKHTICNLLVN